MAAKQAVLEAGRPDRRPGPPRASVPMRRGLCILLVWLASAAFSLFVEYDYEGSSTAQLLYYSVYNVAVGAFAGFTLFDRFLPERAPAFLLLMAAAIGGGTLINETLVEPSVFETGPANFEGIYHGVLDAITIVVVFLVLRFSMPRSLPSPHAERDAAGDPGTASPALPAGASGCLFVRIGDEVRRLAAADIVYLKAERDFTHVVCTAGTHFASESLKDVLAKAAPMGLVRVHKSFAANLRHIDRLTGSEVGLGEHRVPIGRAYREALTQAWRGARTP